MKKETKQHIIFWFILLTLLILLLGSCRTNTVYVPVETVKVEYRDRLYRDKLVRDSVFLTDSVQVPFPVVEYKEVNRLTSFQSFEVWCGRIFFIIIFLSVVALIIRMKLR